MFDPFMFLSLPLSIKKTSKMKMNTRKIFVALVRADPTADVYKVRGGGGKERMSGRVRRGEGMKGHLRPGEALVHV